MPAWKFWPKHQAPILQFCGQEACLNLLIHIHRPTAAIVHAAKVIGPPLGGFLPVSPHRHRNINAEDRVRQQAFMDAIGIDVERNIR
jgi:hypothetical protein